MAIKHLLVDFDGVIRYWSNDNSATEKEFGLPVNSIAIAAFSEELLFPAIRGQVTDGEWRRNVASRLSREYPESRANNAVTNWSLNLGEIDTDILALFVSYANVKLSLVTNATSRLNSDLSVHGIVDAFDNIFNSSELGTIKPEFQLFTEVIERIGARPNEIVFIDDSKENVEAAQQMGMMAHQYVDIDLLKIFLDNIL